MKNFIIFFTLSLTLLFLACKDNTSEQKKAEPVIENEAPQYKNGFPYRSIPQEIMMRVWNEADLLDYIFHDLPFSMSQNEQASIRSNVSYIGQQAQPYIPVDCKPIARQFYQTSGDIFLEADVYFDANCQFYVFYVDGKPAYANMMSPPGVNFFKSMINQALDASKNVVQ